MKRCGYRPGLCSNPGVCELRPVGFGESQGFSKLQAAAGSCSYYVMLAGSRQMAFNLPRRLHQWDADDPDKKE